MDQAWKQTQGCVGPAATDQGLYRGPGHGNGPCGREEIDGKYEKDGMSGGYGEDCDLGNGGDVWERAEVVQQIDRDEVFGSGDPLGLGHGHGLARVLVLEQ